MHTVKQQQQQSFSYKRKIYTNFFHVLHVFLTPNKWVSYTLHMSKVYNTPLPWGVVYFTLNIFVFTKYTTPEGGGVLLSLDDPDFAPAILHLHRHLDENYRNNFYLVFFFSTTR